MKIRNVLIVLLVAAIIGGVIGYQQYNKPHRDLMSEEVSAKITAQELFDDYEKDEAAANEKYLDNILEVSGTIEKVNVGEEKSTVQLRTDDLMAGIICEFEQGELKTIPTAGDKINVRGICTGMLMDVVLVRCVLMKP
ncbi:MAG: hypothetical protein GVX96_05285 [Bacteroidetes bacterium]|jgi:cell division protein YceG involved in septum cleavage|nr:hypothetical protein [Bacteroidota bacterium]